MKCYKDNHSVLLNLVLVMAVRHFQLVVLCCKELKTWILLLSKSNNVESIHVILLLIE